MSLKYPYKKNVRLAVLIFIVSMLMVGCQSKKEKYSEAQRLWSEKDYEASKELFIKLGDYQSSQYLANVVELDKRRQQIKQEALDIGYADTMSKIDELRTFAETLPPPSSVYDTGYDVLINKFEYGIELAFYEDICYSVYADLEKGLYKTVETPAFSKNDLMIADVSNSLNAFYSFYDAAHATKHAFNDTRDGFGNIIKEFYFNDFEKIVLPLLITQPNQKEPLNIEDTFGLPIRAGDMEISYKKPLERTILRGTAKTKPKLAYTPDNVKTIVFAIPVDKGATDLQHVGGEKHGLSPHIIVIELHVVDIEHGEVYVYPESYAAQLSTSQMNLVSAIDTMFSD